ncbi:hypothetical protein DUNSADRAFT_6483 [Dunaliella salina]|uniref:Uncharacterized protein n=1 Tax=Dunaliella salina TaxID=3046 RepID=A0ABQ7FTU3_DUNSA|nr:hypothetical protein DUNSADRAFT_6483 [Dunaliella salina]|eukprot:KAF5825844.1 hypothetical protein DUNSADRAFT_6483 [Dunaliella salina]
MGVAGGGGPMGLPAAMYAQQQAAYMQGRGGPGGQPYQQQQQQQQQGPVPMYAQAHNYGPQGGGAGPPRYGSVDRHMGQHRMQAPAMYGSSRCVGGGGVKGMWLDLGAGSESPAGVWQRVAERLMGVWQE